MRQRVARDPVVRVEDDDHRPVSGAAVVFALPVSGAERRIYQWLDKTLTVTTDPDGLAPAHGLRTNEVSGKLQIYVTAAYRGVRARTLINQFVAASPGAKAKTPELKTSKSGSKWKWVALGVAAAGGAVPVSTTELTTLPRRFLLTPAQWYSGVHDKCCPLG